MKKTYYTINSRNKIVRAQDICYKQLDKKIPLSYIIVIK